MSTELHLTITANSASEALFELASMGLRAAHELGVAPQPANPEPELPLATPGNVVSSSAAEKGNGEDAPTAEKKTRKRATPEAKAATLDKNEIIKGLTDLYMGGDPTVRERITAFRDGYGAQRLRELKDDALPEAQKLLTELIGVAGP